MCCDPPQPPALLCLRRLSGLQLVILGTGAADYEARVRTADQEWGWFCRGHVGFSVPLGHKIMAGCDILLMPSRCVCTRASVGIRDFLICRHSMARRLH